MSAGLDEMDSGSDPLTWDTRVWIARSPDGRETTGSVSLAQISRAFQKGVLGPDVEVSRVGTEEWENIRSLLARHAPLAAAKAASRGHADSDSAIAPELTLTVQRESIVRPPSPSRTELDRPVPTAPPPPPAPPAPSTVLHAEPSGIVAHLFDFSFATPVTPRIAQHIYTVVVFLGATCVVTGIGAAVFTLVMHEGSVGAGVLLAVVWALGGAASGLATVVAGRVVLEAVLAVLELAAHRHES